MLFESKGQSLNIDYLDIGGIHNSQCSGAWWALVSIKSLFTGADILALRGGGTKSIAGVIFVYWW